VVFALAMTVVMACAAAVEDIAVVGLFKNKAVLEIDGKRRVLALGETSPEGVTLVSATTETAVLEFGGERTEYRLGSRISSRFAPAPTGASMQILPDASGMYMVSGSINGFAIRFLVDTGATVVAMNRHQARRMGLDYRLNGIEGSVETASGVNRAFYVVLDRVRVGDIELRQVNATVIDGDYPKDVLLGNSFLGRLDLMRNGKILELRKK